jgi:hypothetical protein
MFTPQAAVRSITKKGRRELGKPIKRSGGHHKYAHRDDRRAGVVHGLRPDPVDVTKEQEIFSRKLPKGKTALDVRGSHISFFCGAEGKEVHGTFKDFNPFTARVTLQEDIVGLPRTCFPSAIVRIY